jgi:hypothetical protein
MTRALLVLLLQAPGPTVGDTVWVERTVGDVAGAVVRPQQWSLGALGQQLGPAEVRHGAVGAVVRYALVLWYPGEHLLTMPGPVLVRRDGRSDTLAVSTVRIRVGSVLPAGERRTTLPPRPASSAMPLSTRAVLPGAILLGVVGVGLLAAALRWRRRGKPIPHLDRAATRADPAMLIRWAAAGEYRAALEGWGWILARRLELSRDLAESAELQRLLDDIAFSVFSRRTGNHLASLAGRAARLGAG